MADDAALIGLIARGDQDALATLYERHAPWLQVRLRLRCADDEVVAEALQETFVAAWRGAGRWRGDGDVGAWLWGIAIRRLIDLLAKRPSHRPLAGVPDPVVASAEEQVLVRVEYAAVATALNRLSPDLIAVVQATVLDGLTTREAARLLKIPQGTVKTRMARARMLLREALS
ncbi:RNA polymerase sigma24 factor [Actinoplanes philippinensis]|uniref:RNA polymerase sigma-70 factor, ECF subfamily n=1 Tax=Actinoplanes philippinensis TaxID=35752 RepID=A0A1I2KJK2_9ACTN|nr:RNA polymerase sigma factor [Actinoplanes philippinensis]GIE81972.1 RNA polymerase sigma24 factor [Actinoplanes philippinensis]SFF65106.1 RNA polymerase sigma-70 factor, ECF subfamily [Actinoplanes philippinensis]